jgi:hypothetical protein
MKDVASQKLDLLVWTESMKSLSSDLDRICTVGKLPGRTLDNMVDNHNNTQAVVLTALPNTLRYKSTCISSVFWRSKT